MKKKIALLFLAVAFCNFTTFGSLNAETAPKASVVKEVVDYFYNGQEEGPILVESKLCKTIKSHNCEEPMDSNVISMGEPIKVWAQFFVPLLIQVQDSGFKGSRVKQGIEIKNPISLHER